MKIANPYLQPDISKLITLELDSSLLSSSVAESTDIATAGQETGSIYEDASSFGDSGFNNNWGD